MFDYYELPEPFKLHTLTRQVPRKGPREDTWSRDSGPSISEH